jgi:hypothetical protein
MGTISLIPMMTVPLDGVGVVTLSVAVPGVAGESVAVMVSDPAETPVAIPVEELIVECAPVSVQTTTHPAAPAATVLESLKVQKLPDWKLIVLEVTTEPGLGWTVIVVSVGGVVIM